MIPIYKNIEVRTRQHRQKLSNFCSYSEVVWQRWPEQQSTSEHSVRVLLNIEADGKSIKVFAQPNSEKPCLLRINAVPELGIKAVFQWQAFKYPFLRACEEERSCIICVPCAD